MYAQEMGTPKWFVLLGLSIVVSPKGHPVLLGNTRIKHPNLSTLVLGDGLRWRKPELTLGCQPNMAVRQNQWHHFGVGAPLILVFVLGLGCSPGVRDFDPGPYGNNRSHSPQLLFDEC